MDATVTAELRSCSVSSDRCIKLIGFSVRHIATHIWYVAEPKGAVSPTECSPACRCTCLGLRRGLVGDGEQSMRLVSRHLVHGDSLICAFCSQASVEVLLCVYSRYI